MFHRRSIGNCIDGNGLKKHRRSIQNCIDSNGLKKHGKWSLSNKIDGQHKMLGIPTSSSSLRPEVDRWDCAVLTSKFHLCILDTRVFFFSNSSCKIFRLAFKLKFSPSRYSDFFLYKTQSYMALRVIQIRQFKFSPKSLKYLSGL